MNLSEEFLANGIVKIEVESSMALNTIAACVRGSLPHDSGLDTFTHNLNTFRPARLLNDIRLATLKELSATPLFRKWYFLLAKNALHELVGNELVMQRNINLSIQLPGDDSSLLPIHADVMQGDSPYEVVLWVPLVDCYGSKSMFFSRKQPSVEGKTLEQLYEECEPYFVDCKYGEALIFSQNYFHGNRINEINETRWSLNCRFKSLFSPYSDKKLGEFFQPIDIRPATQMGLAYL